MARVKCDGCRWQIEGKCGLNIDAEKTDGHCFDYRRGDTCKRVAAVLGGLLTLDAAAVTVILLRHGNAWALICLYWAMLTVQRILARLGEVH